MKSINTLKSLNVSLEELYKGETKQINISLSDKLYVFSVVLVHKGYVKDSVDCKISSFGANLWMRTPKGQRGEKYKSLGTLERALIQQIDKKVDTFGDITFSISNEVYTF